jgi:trans-aconitate methyltransferase
LPTQTFDLIHARLVLIHLPAREQALERMVTALKPGGWLILDEFDVTLLDRSYSTTDALTTALFQKMQAAQDQLMEARGVDLAWGRKLYRRLQGHGLANIRVEGYVVGWRGKHKIVTSTAQCILWSEKH